MHDVNIQASHINALQKQQSSAIKALSQHEEYMSSFMSTVNDRVNKAMEAVQENHKVIIKIDSDFHTHFGDLQNA
jgi:hypothetical protein